MKNKGTIILAIILVVIIAICVVVNITGSSDVEEETSQSATATTQTGDFKIEFDGVNITPGKEFDETTISEEYEYSEISSCAFDGLDKVYTYSILEITVAEIDGVDTVYSVYSEDTEFETEEGVKIADSMDDMIAAYGENYTNEVENKYVYESGNVSLSFIISNDYITSIEYTLNTAE